MVKLRYKRIHSHYSIVAGWEIIINHNIYGLAIDGDSYTLIKTTDEIGVYHDIEQFYGKSTTFFGRIVCKGNLGHVIRFIKYEMGKNNY